MGLNTNKPKTKSAPQMRRKFLGRLPVDGAKLSVDEKCDLRDYLRGRNVNRFRTAIIGTFVPA